jgi:hypothetical protein
MRRKIFSEISDLGIDTNSAWTRPRNALTATVPRANEC